MCFTINVNLLDYKLVSCRYLIIYNNGYGKEYNSYNNQLIFEGEYFDRQRNGYGKEYNKINGKLLFEGKYINGKGKEYYTNGPLKFEGIYFLVEDIMVEDIEMMVVFYMN